MDRRRQLKLGKSPQLSRLLFRAMDGSSLVEFAISLPLLVVLVVGVFDFGGAFNLKQELNNAAREGATFAASQPTNDLDSATPPSVDAVRFLVDAYLLRAKINDCGLGGVSMPGSGGGLTWTYNAYGCGSNPWLVLTIERGLAVPADFPRVADPVNVLYTRVTIKYPYQWHFNSVIQLLIPGANFALTQISTDAAVINTN